MTDDLATKAERIEHRPDGDYYILNAGDLTAEEFSEIIMAEVRELQKGRRESSNNIEE